ncbi:MAG: phosphatidate cytidylyltransferase [Pseudomonadota bacterium]
MGGGSEKWSDLAVRLVSGALLVILGLAGMWVGGLVFITMVALVSGLMVWELVRMLEPEGQILAIGLCGLSALAILPATYLPIGLALPLLMSPALVGFASLREYRGLYAVFTVMVLLAGFGMVSLRNDDLGLGWLLWLVLVVIATDVVGYFAGRMIGGPKFWPRVSPKKTWSGTVCGWVAAAGVGAGFMVTTGAGVQILGVSVAVSIASQMGDIAESAIKRRVGVKDSSNLIPGHGGVLDRFDGMLGAAVFVLLVGPVIGFPPSAV